MYSNLVSVIIPIYKVEKYLDKCIQSVAQQTYKNLEIILVDDGSPDNCPQICDEYTKKDSRIKVIHKENGGLMSARQAGLKIACGDYIGFVDSDDWIEPDMYAHFADAIAKYNCDIAVCEFFYNYPERQQESVQSLKKPFYTKNELMREIYPTMIFAGRFYDYGVMPSCWSKIYKKDLLEKHLPLVDTDITIGEDAAFTFPCMLDAENACYIDKALYHYRINKKSMTQEYSKDLHSKILIPYNTLREYLNKSCYDYSAQLDYYLLSLLNGIVRNEAKKGNPKSRAQSIEVLKQFTKDKSITSAVKRVNRSLLPVHTRFVAAFFSIASADLLYFYAMLLRRFL